MSLSSPGHPSIPILSARRSTSRNTFPNVPLVCGLRYRPAWNIGSLLVNLAAISDAFSCPLHPGLELPCAGADGCRILRRASRTLDVYACPFVRLLLASVLFPDVVSHHYYADFSRLLKDSTEVLLT